MPMNATQQHRFEILQGRLVDEAYVRDYYGIEGLPANQQLLEDMNLYRSTLRAPPAPGDGQFDRYVIEGFLQTRKLLPRKWEAARLGLRVPMLTAIIERRLQLPTPLRKEYLYYGCLVDESLGEDLVRTLPALRFRTFSDHESFCERLHNALAIALQIPEEEMSNAKLWCATDRSLGAFGDYPRRYALYFDCITCDPLSIAHHVWLDFHKPLALGPDRCSKMFYVQNEEVLKAFVAGSCKPEGLERYREALEGGGV
jgi:hypothetical protein